MVSLENKIAYIERIGESPKLRAFYDLLLGSDISTLTLEYSSEADELFFGIIYSLQKNDREKFEYLYNKRSKSNPNKESPSPFVNDDFLVFCLIIGITRYRLDTSWIKHILSIRNRNAITTTLENVLNENYFSKNNLLEIVLMYLQINSPPLITNDLLNNTFKNISDNTILFESKSDLQILCAIKAYDLIILLKDAPDGGEMRLLRSFNSKFIKRTKALSWLLQLCFFLLFLYYLIKLPVYSPKAIEWINQYGYIFTLLGALGITLLSNQIDFLKSKSHEITMRILGYPKDLIEKVK